MLYYNNYLSLVAIAANMLTQLFCTQFFHTNMSLTLQSMQHFPLVLYCNIVIYLDILIVYDLFSLVSGALADIQFSPGTGYPLLYVVILFSFICS